MSEDKKTATDVMLQHLADEFMEAQMDEYNKAMIDAALWGCGYLYVEQGGTKLKHVSYEDLFEKGNFVRGMRNEKK